MLPAVARYQPAVLNAINGQGMRNKEALIINDDKESLGDLEGILAASGHDSVVVYDAFQAVDIVVQRKPDVILLELRMPRKNGFELADDINRALETKKIPIIAMAVLFKEEYAFLLNLCGITRCLRKPFNPLNVLWAVENSAEESRPLFRDGSLENAW